MGYVNHGQHAARGSAIGLDDRAAFLVRTYNHLFGAIVAFTLFEVALFKSGAAETIARAFGGVSWLLILGGFMIVGWLASQGAHRAESRAVQYLALLGYVVAQGLIMVPLLYAAERYAEGTIQSAAVTTLLGFAGLTAIVFWTRKDFSFLGALLRWSGVLALVAIVAAVLFSFRLGTWFSVAMIGLAGGSVLYNTSNILRRFPTDRHVGAALQLFSAVAMMLWYVLRLFMSRR